MTLTLHLLCGPSGSGKSTYAATLLSRPDTISVSPDAMRAEFGDINDQSRNHFIFGTLLPIRLNGAHALRKDVVLDATNTSRKSRKEIIKHARWLGYEVEAHVFHVPIDVCKARNAARDRVVPNEVIDRQFAQWQEPTLEEGFARIVEVHYHPEQVTSTDMLAASEEPIRVDLLLPPAS